MESVLSQTWHDYEWIIIDGGSTDGSKELIEETANKLASSDFNPLSYWCSEPDKGIYNAMNKGISKVNGDYINFMNSGDTFYENCTLNNIFQEKHSADVIYGKVCLVNNEDEKIYSYPNPVSIHRLYRETICHQATFTKSDYLKHSGFDESFKICADHAKFVEMAINYAVFEFVPITVCRYDINGISYTMLDIIKQETDTIRQELFPPTVRELILAHDITNKPMVAKSIEIVHNGGFTYKFFKGFINIIQLIGKIKQKIQL